MKTAALKFQNISSFLMGTVCAVLAVCLIVYSKSVCAGVIRGLSMCAESIIPSLFVFIILSIFLCRSPAGKAVSILFYPVTRFVLRLDPKLGCTVVMSMVGGYPVGASLISDMVKSGELSEKTASRMMWFCSNAGPAFVVTAVGVNMFGSFSVGIILLLSHLTSSLIIGAFVGRFSKAKTDITRKSGDNIGKKPVGDIFVESVSAAVNSIFAICAYVVIFSALLALIGESAFINTAVRASASALSLDSELLYGILNGFFEVTTACAALGKTGSTGAVCAAAFFISFSGISVILQVRHCFANTGVKHSGYIVSRFLSGALSAVLAKVLLGAFPSAVSASGALDNPVIKNSAGSIANSVILVLMCCAFVYSSSRKKLKNDI